MQKISVLIFPYRDSYFYEKYGPIVRDLHIIEALLGSRCVVSVMVVNRPVSIYERLLGKRYSKPNNWPVKVGFFDVTSFDFLGPLGGRGWTETCYDKYLGEIKSKFDLLAGDSTKVLLDFTPMANIDLGVFDGYFKWYDLIDNFIKHNRYNDKQKKLVSKKYSAVRSYDLVTGVSAGALAGVNCLESKKLILSNGIRHKSEFDYVDPIYDFGFIGFVTNKFSVDFLRAIKSKFPGCKIAIFGEFYDSKLKSDLESLAKCYGVFKESDLPGIMAKFKIGLVPYKISFSHDESPLKIYQYLNFGKPVISTIDYGIDSCWVHVSDNDNEIDESSATFLRGVFQEDFSKLTRGVEKEVRLDYLWENKIEDLIRRITYPLF